MVSCNFRNGLIKESYECCKLYVVLPSCSLTPLSPGSARRCDNELRDLDVLFRGPIGGGIRRDQVVCQDIIITPSSGKNGL